MNKEKISLKYKELETNTKERRLCLSWLSTANRLIKEREVEKFYSEKAGKIKLTEKFTEELRNLYFWQKRLEKEMDTREEKFRTSLAMHDMKGENK